MLHNRDSKSKEETNRFKPVFITPAVASRTRPRKIEKEGELTWPSFSATSNVGYLVGLLANKCRDIEILRT